jgi:hypothetical protein
MGVGNAEQSSKAFAKVAEHINAVRVDFLSRGSLPILGECAASRFEGNAG